MAWSPAASYPYSFKMGRSNHYVSPSTKIRSIKRALKYLIEKQVLLRKLPALTIEKTYSLDIPPASVNRTTSHPSLFPKQKCAKPLNFQDVNQQPYQPQNQRNLSNSSRTFKSGRRQLPAQQTSSKIQWCYSRCPTTGEWIQTIP